MSRRCRELTGFREFRCSSWLYALISASCLGCGTETGNPGDDKKALDSRNALSLQVSTQLLEVTDSFENSTDEVNSTDGASLMEDRSNIRSKDGNFNSNTHLLTERSCSTLETAAIVDKNSSFSKPFSFEGNSSEIITGNLEKSLKSQVSFKRRDGLPISCDRLGRFPIINSDSYKVLITESTFESEAKRESASKAATGAFLKQSNIVVSKSGTRGVAFSIISEGSDDEIHVREITSTSEQKLEIEEDNKISSLQSRIMIETQNPLVLRIKKSGILSPWTTATIASGQVTSKLSDGSQTVTNFKNVMIQRSAPCSPESGTITGTHTPSGGKAAAPVTYVVTFEKGTSWIRFGSDEKKEILPFGLCPAAD